MHGVDPSEHCMIHFFMFKHVILSAVLAVLVLAVPSHAHVMVRFSDCNTTNNHFVSELISSALAASNPEVNFVRLKCYPHLRKRYMLRQGTIDILPLLQSKKYDQELIPINVPLTEGLISQRVLVTNKSKLELFEDVRSLDEFRALDLVGAFGKNWFGAKVWAENGLKYVTMADWKLIYPLLCRSNSRIDYFSRSVLEAKSELKEHPELVIVPNLLFLFDRNVICYLSPKHKELKPVLEKALKEAQSSGLISRLIEKYYGQDVDGLDLEKRTVIHLNTPE